MTEPLFHSIVREIRADGIEIIYEQWALLLDEAQGAGEFDDIVQAILEHDSDGAFFDWYAE